MKQVEAEKKKSVHIQSERPVMTGVKCKKKKTQHAFAGGEYVKDGR
jgi:hypothetical protein